MKTLILLAVFLLSTFSFAGTLSFDQFSKLSIDQKSQILIEYREFLHEYHSADNGKTSARIFSLFLDEAYASSLNCFYAGWPSQKVGGKCTSPQRADGNGYQQGSCASGQLQCQPALFGAGHCASVRTQKQRNIAFSQCERKSSRKNIANVVQQLTVSPLKEQAITFLGLVNEICAEATGNLQSMCRRLQNRIAAIGATAIGPAVRAVETHVEAAPFTQAPAIEVRTNTIQDAPAAEAEAIAVAAPRQQDAAAVNAVDIAINSLSTPVEVIIPQCDQCEANIDDSNMSEHDRARRQLMTALPPYDTEADPLESTSRRSVRVLQSACDEYETRRQEILSSTIPMAQRPAAFSALRPLERLCSTEVGWVNGKVTSIHLRNNTPNAINTTALDNTSGASREFNFEFPDRNRKDMALRITDNAGIASAGMSHNLMESTIVFIPRRVVPRIELVEGNPRLRRMYLPTGETVDYDPVTNELKGGALNEAPIDVSPDRHSRKFAGVNYSGRGITIRVDRRGGTPEHTYSTPFNSNERVREATITHNGRTCRVSKSLIWNGTNNPDGDTSFKYGTDQAFLNTVINGQCRWNLSLQDL